MYVNQVFLCWCSGIVLYVFLISSGMPLLLILAVILILRYIQFWWSRRYLYTAAAKIKGPRGFPLIGNAHMFIGDTADFFQKLNSIFSHVDNEPYKIWLGPYLLISLKNPVHLEKIMSSSRFAQKHELYVFLEKFVGEGLISSSGINPKYKTHRRMIQPLMDLKFVARSISIIQEQTDICMKKLQNYVDKSSFDIHDVIINCSVDIMGEIILGQQIDSQKNGPTKFCQALVEMYDLAYTRMTKVWLHPDFIYNRLSLKSKSDAVHNDLKDFIQKALMDSRIRQDITKNDQDEQFIPTIDRLLEIIDNNQDVMNDEDLVHHLITLFAAADDTFAIIASFSVLCLGMYPDYQVKATEEIRNVIGEEPRPISMEDIYKLQYLDMCIKDVMRLFTIAPYILRRNLENFQLDEWTLPRGAAIVIPIHHLHRDPAHWDNPDHFHPDHFLPEAVRKRHVYAYLPFSSGPRGCIGSLSALSAGILYSWSSPFIVQITNDKENYDITVDQASYFTMIPPIVMIFSCNIASRFCDSIGRKRTLLMIAIPQICSWILCIIASDVYVFYLARLCSGIGDGIMFSALPMYIGEVCTPEVRSFWGTSLNLMVSVGQLLINIVGSYCTVRQTSYIFIGLPVIFLLTFSSMPESPYFHIIKGKDDHARTCLKKLRRKNDIEDDFNQLKSDVHRQISESATWTDVVTIPSNRRALIAGVFLRISQQCTGFSAIGVFNKFIFENSAGSVSSSISAIITSAVSCIMALLGGLVIARVGRKLSYIISLVLSACMLLLLAVFYYMKEYYPELDMVSFGWFPLVALLLYLVFAGMGISIIPTTMLSELFSASIKAKGLSILLLVFGCIQFLGNYLFMFLFLKFGIYSPFLLYGICCFISAMLSIYLVPETKGKTLEDIQKSMKNDECVVSTC